MRIGPSLCVSLALAACLGSVWAQAFPDDATPASADEISKRFAGKTFRVSLADGGSWRVEYKANGYYFFNASSGFTDSGEWKSEEGKICNKGRRGGSSCNEIRVKEAAIYLKRDSGEIVQFVPQ